MNTGLQSIRRPLLGERQHLLLNAGLFQLAWLLCVIGGTAVALPTTAVVLTVHLYLADHPAAELRFLLFALLLGLVTDRLLMHFGVLRFGEVTLQPLWLLCLWPLFASTCSYALRFFQGRWLLCALVGGLSAPLSYFGGSRLADVALLEPLWLAIFIIACTWALVFPVMMLVHRQMFRWRTE